MPEPLGLVTRRAWSRLLGTSVRGPLSLAWCVASIFLTLRAQLQWHSPLTITPSYLNSEPRVCPLDPSLVYGFVHIFVFALTSPAGRFCIPGAGHEAAARCVNMPGLPHRATGSSCAQKAAMNAVMNGARMLPHLQPEILLVVSAS